MAADDTKYISLQEKSLEDHIKESIDKGWDLDRIVHKDKGTFLHMAVMIKNYILIRKLIKHLADVNVEYRGETPLSTAVNKGYVRIVKILIRAGATVSVSDVNRAQTLKNYKMLMILVSCLQPENLRGIIVEAIRAEDITALSILLARCKYLDGECAFYPALYTGKYDLCLLVLNNSFQLPKITQMRYFRKRDDIWLSPTIFKIYLERTQGETADELLADLCGYTESGLWSNTNIYDGIKFGSGMEKDEYVRNIFRHRPDRTMYYEVSKNRINYIHHHFYQSASKNYPIMYKRILERIMLNRARQQMTLQYLAFIACIVDKTDISSVPTYIIDYCDAWLRHTDIVYDFVIEARFIRFNLLTNIPSFFEIKFN